MKKTSLQGGSKQYLVSCHWAK